MMYKKWYGHDSVGENNLCSSASSFVAAVIICNSDDGYDHRS